MRPSFNVLDCGWIPVVSADGTIRELGIRETLAQAHELREISDPSPLEEYSVYRFLSIFLMDALRPQKKSDIRSLLRAGSFDMAQIEQYIALCESEGVSFDLFDEKRPFLQSTFDSANDTDKIRPASKLDCTLPRESSHTHFYHDAIENTTLSPSKAIRLLLATYIFCVADGRGYYYSVYGAPPYFGVIKGRNLFETLTAHLLPTNTIGIPFDDPPVFWRNFAPVVPERKVGMVSWLQGMLFPARKIQLLPNQNGTVSKIYLFSGEKYENPDAWREPYATYHSEADSVYPLCPTSENSLWRNISEIADTEDHALRFLQIYKDLHEDEYVHLTLYGVHVKKGQATYYSLRRHDLRFSLILSNPGQISLLTQCASSAQDMGRVLWRSLVEIGTVSSAVISTASREYDASCEKQFWKLCEEAAAPDADLRELYSAFCADISDCVMQAFEDALKSIRLRAHQLAIAEKQRSRLYSETIKLKKEANP